MRSYTVDQIDRMRADVEWLRKHRCPVEGPVERYDVDLPSVEDELRTLMMAGVKVEELSDRRDERQWRLDRRQEWRDAEREVLRRYCSHEWHTCKRSAGLYGYGCCNPRHNKHYGRYFCSGGRTSCRLCDLPDRRSGNRGRPGGRRKGDVPRTLSEAPITVPVEPVKLAPPTSTTWWRRLVEQARKDAERRGHYSPTR